MSQIKSDRPTHFLENSVSRDRRRHLASSPQYWPVLEVCAKLRAARRRKEIVYAELVHSSRAKLLVLGNELGGRFSKAALDLVRRLARCRCQRAPRLLRRCAQFAWHRRWLCLISVAAQAALAAALAQPSELLRLLAEPAEPADADVWGCRLAPVGSRLPLR